MTRQSKLKISWRRGKKYTSPVTLGGGILSPIIYIIVSSSFQLFKNAPLRNKFSTIAFTKNLYDSKDINFLLPIAQKSARIGKISILKLERIKKNSYERRDYKSVDEKSLS